MKYLLFILLVSTTICKADELDSYIQAILKKSLVPGVAVAIVKGDQVIFAKGFGVRIKDRPEPVDVHTRFAIGSATKAMTATAMAMLQQDGLLGLSQPIIEYAPDFGLKDPVASRKATLIDALSHQTGLPRHDMIWYGFDNQPRSYFWRKLKYLEPSSGFRETWQYTNLMYMAAGYILERTSGKTWEDFLTERLFRPLEMHETTSGDFDLIGDVAFPHSFKGGWLQTIAGRPSHAFGPALGVNSTILDMAHWLSFNIGKGKWQSRSLVGSDLMSLVHDPKVRLPTRFPDQPEFSDAEYALGWIRQQYRGHNLVWHDGNIDGYKSFVGFMPEEGWGVVVLQNSDHMNISFPLALRAFDEVLNAPKEDWFDRFRRMPANPAFRPLKASVQKQLEHPLSSYTGVFENAAYGKIELHETPFGLTLYFHNFNFELSYLNDGSFRISSPDFNQASSLEPATFEFKEDESMAARLLLRFEPKTSPIVFERVDH